MVTTSVQMENHCIVGHETLLERKFFCKFWDPSPVLETGKARQTKFGAQVCVINKPRRKRGHVTFLVISDMLSPIQLSSLTLVHLTHSAGGNFEEYLFAIWYLGHPLTFTENFTEIVPGVRCRRKTITSVSKSTFNSLQPY